jgi:hypothetical protein
MTVNGRIGLEQSPERFRDQALWCGETLFSSLSSTVADGGAGT